MFVNMAFVNPHEGKETEMAGIMRDLARLLENSPGLIAAHLMCEKGKTTLLGISMWENEEAFSSAMQKVNPPPTQAPIETLRKDVRIRQFLEA